MPPIRQERLKLADLKPYPGNARKGNLGVIKESLRKHGQYRTIVVQESTGYVLAGNHTLLAAEELGWDELDGGIIDVDDEQAKRIVLVDNRSNDLAAYDDQALADLLIELPDLEGTGFTDDDMNTLLLQLGPGGFKQSEMDMVIKVPTNPVTERGEWIELGPHRLWCGDSLADKPPAFDDFTGTVDLVWTDPPYLISYQTSLTEQEARELHRRVDGKEVFNEDLSSEEAYAFRMAAAALLSGVLRPGGAYYMFSPPGADQADWINALDAAGMKPRQVLQWIKDQFVFGRSDYHYRSEPFFYGWRPGHAHTFLGGRSQDSVWEFDRPKRSKDHPTIKPVELAIRAVENSTKPGELVFDPFAGSGTILIACMQASRRAVMWEIDPAYCDVIVERYERLSGEQAIRHKEQ